MFSALQLAEFIYEQPAAGDVEYTFKHALTHDVAYNSVLIAAAIRSTPASAPQRSSCLLNPGSGPISGLI